MSLFDITSLCLIEIIGDFSLKHFANKGGLHYFATGIVGYIGVIYFLIRALQGSTVLLVNGAWDGISTLIESFAAYFILGERFEHIGQYFGLLFIIIGIFLLQIPLKRSKEFINPFIFL